MSAHTWKISIKKLVSLISIASTSVYLSFPALALNNSNPNRFNASGNNNRTSSADSTARSRQLLAQGTSGTGGTGAGGTGTGQTGNGGTGTGTGRTGSGGTGTGTGTGQTGNGTGRTGTGTGQTNTGRPTSSNGSSNSQQNAFTQYMLVGYAATEQRDYQTALINFRRALQLRPGNPYATRAISNVQSYIQRSR